MSSLLSLVAVLTFSAAAPVCEPQEFYVELAAPVQDELPANAQMYFWGYSEGQFPSLELVKNDSAAQTLALESTGFNGVEAQVLQHYSVEVGAVVPGDQLRLEGVLLDSPLSFLVVENDVSPPAIDAEAVVDFEVDSAWPCNPTEFGGCPMAVYAVFNGGYSDDFGVAYFRIEDDAGEVLSISAAAQPQHLFYFQDQEPRTVCARFVAVDVAGNESSTDLQCGEVRGGGPLGCNHSGNYKRGASKIAFVAFGLLLIGFRRRNRPRGVE